MNDFEDLEADVDDLAFKAEIEKEGQLASFLYLRAKGMYKTESSGLVGVSTRTLGRWEEKMEENLNALEQSELVAKAVVLEHEERFNEVEISE